MALYHRHPFCYPMWKGRHISDIPMSALVTDDAGMNLISHRYALSASLLLKKCFVQYKLYLNILNIYLENVPILDIRMIFRVENNWLLERHLFQHCRLSGSRIDGGRTVNQHDQDLGRECHLDKCTAVAGRENNGR